MAAAAPQDHNHYVPVLKGKAGEYQALAETQVAARALISPLIELAPPDGKQTIDQVCALFATKIAKGWGAADRLFVDTLRLDPTLMTASRRPPLELALQLALATGFAPIPVTGISRSARYQSVIAQHAAAQGTGAALRLSGTDTRSATLGADVAATLAQIALAATDVDLIIDVGPIVADVAAVLALGLNALIRGLPHLADWRSFTVVSSSFPQPLTHRGVSRFPRVDWDFWQAILATTPARKPAFGDYAIETPGFVSFPAYIEPSAAIRFTTPTEWLVIRGTSIRKPPRFDQFRQLSRTLVGLRNDFRGPAFSWGDRFIYECANGTGRVGNLTTWRAVGTNHHLETVADQLPTVP